MIKLTSIMVMFASVGCATQKCGLRIDFDNNTIRHNGRHITESEMERIFEDTTMSDMPVTVIDDGKELSATLKEYKNVQEFFGKYLAGRILGSMTKSTSTNK